ncbi:hypothetical protein V8F20_001401 [Naviculisporaceae sp. PSN 640]
MKFTILIILGLASLTSALNILPAVRSVPLNGGETNPTLTERQDAPAPNITITCTNRSIDIVDQQVAATKLGNWCSDGAFPYLAKHGFIVGGTRVYVCNWSMWNDATCSFDEIVRAQNAIASKCGLNRGGTWYRDDWEKSYGFDAVDDWQWCLGLAEEGE